MLDYISAETMAPEVRAVLLGRPRVLMVEDDDDLAYGLELLLSRAYDVAVAQSAREAVDLHGGMKPDVLLVDYHLPDSNGIRLFESLVRQYSHVPPAIMLSAYAGRREACMVAGFDDFLEKPCPPARLLKAIENALGSV